MNNSKEYIPGRAENKRLLLQNQLLNSFDYDVYASVLNAVDSPLTILDVGCNSGDMMIPRLQGFDVAAYIGIDKSEAQIEKARQHYADDSYGFFAMDIETEDFESRLAELMKGYNISSFSIINISMVLLHLKDPQRLLNVLRNFLDEHGTIIVRDIDDSLNIAYPDEHELFTRVYRIAEADELTGNRFTGRKVFHYLQKAGYRSIELKRIGMTTAGLNNEQKREFYDMSFGFILGRTAAMHDKYPEDSTYSENYRWAMEHGTEIRDLFMQEDFSAIIGFMTYTARRI